MKYTTNIPEARKVLRGIADEIEEHAPCQARRIRETCLDLMTRKPHGRRAPVRSQPLDQETIASIRADLSSTDKSQEQIAHDHGVDGGRVSEILNMMRNS